ncbi:hypothetical protein [Pseudomonas sp. MF6768]|jgi:hypothetical protein|uniref:hypothetical protein n=1 Tax=Pseudomonas sp. MF6768 TaxID=2797532 RepID=UPI0018E8C1EE|nr:hypothetical protein [Pseudomonas sp. MF6768]MBJ2242238.1 hypothetical protein [Pseudomonas sp. MF6768]
MAKTANAERIEFFPGVSTTVWKRAGGLCSIRKCLKPVFGTDGNLDTENGPHRATTIGEAAHIYSAKENWARGQGGKPPEFIASSENAISTCRNCHRNVDIVDSKYSADSLFEMKRVRETAQDMARHNQVVSFYVSQIGTRELDELIWEAPDRSDEQSIAHAFIRFAESAVQALREIKESICHEMPKPVGMSTLPIVSAMNQVREPDEYAFGQGPIGPIQQLHFADLRQTEADQIARTIELAEGWSCGEDNILVVETVRCEVFTRDLITGIASESVKLNVRAGVLKNTDSEKGRQAVLKLEEFEHSSVGFNWELTAVLNQDGHTLESNLKLRRFACPDNTEDDREFEVFAGYARILKEIDAGRLPCARLSRLNSMSRHEEQTPWNEDCLHPLEFAMNVVESSERVRDVVAFNDKALMGYRVSLELEALIVYRCSPLSKVLVSDHKNNALLGFFDHRLTEHLIREAIHEVREKARIDLTPRLGVVSKPMVVMQRLERPHTIRAHHKNSITWFRLEPVSEGRRSF